MGKTLTNIAQTLKDCEKQVQLIYAFNGVGKTRLSLEFKELIAPKTKGDEYEEENPLKIIYYNAFTEDLFYWNNDLDEDTNRKLIIQPNSFTNWIFKEQGYEDKITKHFQCYTNDKLTPSFNEELTEITFSLEGGNDSRINNIKISKGEESCFIWCIFYSLLDLIIETLNEPEEDRETDRFNKLEYIFIDDPVSSLDENHLIDLAVNVAELIKKSRSTDIKFIITTHNPLFYNVLYNELKLNKKKECYLLDKQDDGSYVLDETKGDSNKSFSYHLHLISILQNAIRENKIEKYHFVLLRNLYEKTASFLGYIKWSDLLPDDKKAYYNRIIQFTSHSTLSSEAVSNPTESEKNTLKLLFNHLVKNNNYYISNNANDTI